MCDVLQRVFVQRVLQTIQITAVTPTTDSSCSGERQAEGVADCRNVIDEHDSTSTSSASAQTPAAAVSSADQNTELLVLNFPVYVRDCFPRMMFSAVSV